MSLAVERHLETRPPRQSSVVRASAAQIAAIRAYARGELDAAWDHLNEALDAHVVGSGFWFASLQQRALVEFGLGRHDAALATADLDLDHAFRIGDRSAMIIPIGIYALVLRDHDEVTAVATLRGFLPKRITLMLVNELADLDRWLSERTTAEERARLGAAGAAMTARELQALAHTTMAPHLDPRED